MQFKHVIMLVFEVLAAIAILLFIIKLCTRRKRPEAQTSDSNEALVERRRNRSKISKSRISEASEEDLENPTGLVRKPRSKELNYLVQSTC